ncbi:hypothetical protein E6C27_scaffold510G00120 [Cucumis melo var. makuwa]|uniref:Uncharacterized protein n=1 Tax=Cucumis melo var. makuwa TaxID=1194695 RepID=A0A5A7SZS1_CUCMM|nr:hypothetical protein E6C27_scaffold510G00120 [Cucumis melo var. makuwa]
MASFLLCFNPFSIFFHFSTSSLCFPAISDIHSVCLVSLDLVYSWPDLHSKHRPLNALNDFEVGNQQGSIVDFTWPAGHLSLPSSTSGHSESSVRIVFDNLPNVAITVSSLNIGVRLGPIFCSLKVDPLSVDSIGGHNQVSGKGFPTTGPRIEAGNVVTRPLVVACVPSGVRNSVRIGTDAGCSVRGSLLSGFWSWSLVVEGRTRLICASFESTRLICASLGITRLIGVSFGITRLICVFYGTTRLLCRVRAQRGADRREAGRMREGHMDASVMNFVFCGRVLALSSDLSLVRKVGSLQQGSPATYCSLSSVSV